MQAVGCTMVPDISNTVVAISARDGRFQNATPRQTRLSQYESLSYFMRVRPACAACTTGCTVVAPVPHCATTR